MRNMKKKKTSSIWLKKKIGTSERKKGGKDKNSVSEEWHDKAFVKARLMENKKLADR